MLLKFEVDIAAAEPPDRRTDPPPGLTVVAAMQRALEDFLRSLRDNEVTVSPAEAIDAHRALVKIGYADRTLLRDALCVTLAKGEDEVTRFERCFDTFFERGATKATGELSGYAPGRAPDLVENVLRGDEAALSQAMEAAGAHVGAGQYSPRHSTQFAGPSHSRRHGIA